jgi:N-acetylglucosaminyldiphosphoundecaprenol N-acetyl-beta-D-mannosaminyltransferase
MAFGLRFSTSTRAELVQALKNSRVPTGSGARIICTANLDHIVQLQKNAALRDAYAAAWCVTADGLPVFAYARFKRDPVPSRVTGSDLAKDLVLNLPPDGHRCFFVVSCADTAEGIARLMLARGFPRGNLAFEVPPYGFERDAGYSNDLARRIKAHGSTLLFFGVGAPKSEIWTHRNRDAIGDCYVLNAGAGLDYVCGVRRRAPTWMQRAGLEWFWRFASEPGRLFRRYFVDSWGFLSAIYVDLRTPRPTY